LHQLQGALGCWQVKRTMGSTFDTMILPIKFNRLKHRYLEKSIS